MKKQNKKIKIATVKFYSNKPNEVIYAENIFSEIPKVANVSIRLPEKIKSRCEKKASESGLSFQNFLIKTLYEATKELTKLEAIQENYKINKEYRNNLRNKIYRNLPNGMME